MYKFNVGFNHSKISQNGRQEKTKRQLNGAGNQA